MITATPPDTIPAIAPGLFVRFQNSDNTTSGPNAAPKPAHGEAYVSCIHN